ncbi:MAG: alpha/beta hydrolase [Betaproteobacteria bacterium]
MSLKTGLFAALQRWLRQLFPAALLMALLSGCSVVGLFNTLIPEGGLEATRDIAYGQLPRQKLDVYKPVVPLPAGNGARPVVVFFYGGAWDSGDKASYLFAAEALTSRGYLVVIPNYRVYPDVVFPTYMEDAALAVKWTFDNAARLGGDPDKIFTMGHSAGAQLAALIAFDGSYLEKVGLDKRRLRGMVSLAGPMDFLPLDEPKLFLIFPGPVRAASQPINFISGKEAPVLLLHGLDDKRVGIHNSRNLAARIRERGGKVEEDYYPGMGHVGILLAISAPLRSGKPVLDRVSKFIDERAAQR